MNIVGEGLWTNTCYVGIESSRRIPQNRFGAFRCTTPTRFALSWGTSLRYCDFVAFSTCTNEPMGEDFCNTCAVGVAELQEYLVVSG